MNIHVHVSVTYSIDRSSSCRVSFSASTHSEQAVVKIAEVNNRTHVRAVIMCKAGHASHMFV